MLAVVSALAACSSADENALLGEPDNAGEGGQEDDPDAALAPVGRDAGPVSDAGAGSGAGDASDAGGGASCAIVKPASAPYLRYGLHPRASDALAHAKVTSARITQTIGSAAASAGTHAQDGTAEGRPYTTAVDLSVRDMSDAEVATFLDQLTEVGFVAFFRKPGSDGWPADEVRHIHAIWAAAPMKLSLRNQVRDWYAGKNGLASHTPYKFKTWSACWRETIWKAFLTANPATG